MRGLQRRGTNDRRLGRTGENVPFRAPCNARSKLSAQSPTHSFVFRGKPQRHRAASIIVAVLGWVVEVVLERGEGAGARAGGVDVAVVVDSFRDGRPGEMGGFFEAASEVAELDAACDGVAEHRRGGELEIRIRPVDDLVPRARSVLVGDECAQMGRVFLDECVTGDVVFWKGGECFGESECGESVASPPVVGRGVAVPEETGVGLGVDFLKDRGHCIGVFDDLQ